MSLSSLKRRISVAEVALKALRISKTHELVNRQDLENLRHAFAVAQEQLKYLQDSSPHTTGEDTPRTIQGKLHSDDFHVRLDYHSAGVSENGKLPKPSGEDFFARSRDAISDPINTLIEKHPTAGGITENGLVVLHNGLQVPLIGPDSYYGEFSHLLVVNRGIHEPLEEFLFQKVVNAMSGAPTMIELGAYWSHYSMWMKSHVPESQVIMVEPEAENIEAGKSNFLHNDLQGEFIQAFVGAGHFEIDKFVDKRKLNRIDLLHCDIQGFEVEMLDGATKAFGDGLIDRVFISTHSNELHDACLSKLTAFGYKIIASSDFRETTSWDGIVFAVRDESLSPLKEFLPASREQIYDFSLDGVEAYLKTVQAAVK